MACLHIFDGIVDDAVQTNIYLLPLCSCLCCCIRTYVEADDDGIGCSCQSNVGLVDGTNAAVDDLYHDFLVGELQKALLYSLYRTLYICFDDHVQLF